MAETSLPFEDTDVNETQFGKWARLIVGNGVAEGLAVEPGTGMQVQVPTGQAIVQGVLYINDAAKTLTIGAAPSTAGQSRIDLVVLRLDLAANTLTAVVKAGTASSSPAAPSLQQDASVWEHALATVTVPASVGAITSGMIQQRLADQGRRWITYPNAAQRPTPTEPVALGLDLSTKALELYTTAGGWVTLANSVAWANVTGKPTTFAPTRPLDADSVLGFTFAKGTSLPGTVVENQVFFLLASGA